MELITSIIKQAYEGIIKTFDGDGRSLEIFTDRRIAQHYGFSGFPLQGAELFLIKHGNQVVSVAEDDRRYRPLLQPGEVSLFNAAGEQILQRMDNSTFVLSDKVIFNKAENQQGNVRLSSIGQFEADQSTQAQIFFITNKTNLFEMQQQTVNQAAQWFDNENNRIIFYGTNQQPENPAVPGGPGKVRVVIDGDLCVTGDICSRGNLTVDQGATIQGPAQLNSTLGVTGHTTLSSLSVSGLSDFAQNVTMQGNLTVEGLLTANGGISGDAAFDNLTVNGTFDVLGTSNFSVRAYFKGGLTSNTTMNTTSLVASSQVSAQSVVGTSFGNFGSVSTSGINVNGALLVTGSGRFQSGLTVSGGCIDGTLC